MTASSSPYPRDSYRRLYDPSVGSLWTPEGGLPLEEDGDHYRSDRDFFEWWYFDAAFDNGYRLVAILHSTLFNAVDHKPTIDIRVTPPGASSTLAVGRYSRSQYRSEAGRCNLQISGCRAETCDGTAYHLLLRQGEVEADLTYQAAAPGWRPGNGYLFSDPATGHFFKWVVPLPLARVSGELTIHGQKMRVQGSGYHDHNWGNFALWRAFSRWTWGRVTSVVGDRPMAVVFGDVTGSGAQPEHIRPFFVFLDGIILDGNPAISVREHNPLREPQTGVCYPSKIEVTAHSPDFDAVLSIRSRRLLEAVDFPCSPFLQRWPRQLYEIAFYLTQSRSSSGSLFQRLFRKASYLRLTAAASLELCGRKAALFEDDAIVEVMQFNAPDGSRTAV